MQHCPLSCAPLDPQGAQIIQTITLTPGLVSTLRDIPFRLSLGHVCMRIVSMMTLLHLIQALSPTGRCKSFEATAAGYGRGEGFNALLLRSPGLSNGKGGRPLALALASAVNQDGRSSSLTAPNGPAQQVGHDCHHSILHRPAQSLYTHSASSIACQNTAVAQAMLH